MTRSRVGVLKTVLWNSSVYVALSFKVLGEVIVSGTQMYAIVHFGRLERATPLTGRLVEGVQEVVTLTILQKSLSVFLTSAKTIFSFEKTL